MNIEQNGLQWNIQRRYTDFRLLHQALASNSSIDIEFPGKKFTGNKDRDFVALRQNALQNFLWNVTSHPILRQSLTLKKLIHPLVYSTNSSGIHF